MPEEKLKATLEIEAKTNKAQKQIYDLIKSAEKEGKDVLKVLEHVYSDKRLGKIKKEQFGEAIAYYKEQRKLYNLSQRNIFGKASRATSSEGALLELKKILGKSIYEYENRNEPIANARLSLATKEKQKLLEEEKIKQQIEKSDYDEINRKSKEDWDRYQDSENKRIREKYKTQIKFNKENKNTIPAFLYAMRFFAGRNGGIANTIVGISKNLRKWTAPNAFGKRADALGRVLSRSGLGAGLAIGGIIGAGIFAISKLIKTANESIPYARALSGTSMTGLGSTMSSFQAAGFGKERGLGFRTNLLSMAGNLKLGRGNAAAFMALGINALDSTENIQKQFIERLKTLPEDTAVALGQDFGFSYQEVMAARRGDLDERSMKYNEEYMKKWGEIGIDLHKIISDMKVFFYNTISEKAFDFFKHPLDYMPINPMGYSNIVGRKLVAQFQNLNVNIDKDGKASIEGSVESNDINFDSLFQQMGDNN